MSQRVDRHLGGSVWKCLRWLRGILESLGGHLERAEEWQRGAGHRGSPEPQVSGLRQMASPGRAKVLGTERHRCFVLEGLAGCWRWTHLRWMGQGKSIEDLSGEEVDSEI